MHTAHQLAVGLFGIRLAGAPATLADVLPDLDPRDRLGVVVHEPFGALGASLLIQLFTAASYAARPERRTTRPQYPELYLLHVGEGHGDHRAFDFWPPRKEVVVPADADAVLGALNDRAITHLLVPDGPAAAPSFTHWADAASIAERLRAAFAYAPDGEAAAADVVLEGRDPALEENAERALDPHARLAWFRSLPPEGIEQRFPGPTSRAEVDRWLTTLVARADEVPAADRHAAAERHRARRRDGRSCEGYRRLSLDEALRRLLPAAA